MSGETSFLTLGIETSCDETSVAILRGEHDVLINSVYSQVDLHAKYGGVVPEVASRNHVLKLPYLVQEAMQSLGMQLKDMSLIAATYGPGLVGPLLVGLTHGKGLACGLEIPFIGVNHLEGHVFAHWSFQAGIRRLLTCRHMGPTNWLA